MSGRRDRIDLVALGLGFLLALLLAGAGAVAVEVEVAAAAAAAVDIREVPPTLNNAVRLAGYFSEISQGSIQPGLRVDMEKAHLTNLQAEMRKKPKSKDAAFEDDFESSEVSGVQWESFLGGEVNTLCGSVEGQALCFGGDAFAADEVEGVLSVGFAMRQAVTGVMNTIAISKVRFSLAIAHPYTYREEPKLVEADQDDIYPFAESSAPISSTTVDSEAGAEGEKVRTTSSSVVILEYKAAGGAWTVLQSFSAHNYTTWRHEENDTVTDLPIQNSAIKGEKVFRFVTHEIELPEATRSLATKFRWQQLKVIQSHPGHPGHPSSSSSSSNPPHYFPSWALDDVSILLQGGEGGPPGVLLVMHGTDNFQEHLVSSKLLTVLVHVNTQVIGLDASKFAAEGDVRIVSLNKLSSSIGSRMGGTSTSTSHGHGGGGGGVEGEHYTLTLLKGRKKATLSLPEKVCKNLQGVGNAASNVLTFPGEEEKEEKKEL